MGFSRSCSVHRKLLLFTSLTGGIVGMSASDACNRCVHCYPDLKEGITLSTTRAQEAGDCTHYDDAFAVMDRSKKICCMIPAHSVFGEHNDMTGRVMRTQQPVDAYALWRELKYHLIVQGSRQVLHVHYVAFAAKALLSQWPSAPGCSREAVV
ncbi:hypothetical protein C8Q73DRAFT_64525 [Cubamyces lactineus]|nr:hypothetical protein C8Q73DRAFT_64525 [Cubamyces lactineus]